MTDNSTKGNSTAEQLRAYVQRIERLSEERKTMSEDINSVFAEAKNNGYDVKALKAIIKLRAADANEIAEQEALIDLYKNALGMI